MLKALMLCLLLLPLFYCLYVYNLCQLSCPCYCVYYERYDLCLRLYYILEGTGCVSHFIVYFIFICLSAAAQLVTWQVACTRTIVILNVFTWVQEGWFQILFITAILQLPYIRSRIIAYYIALAIYLLSESRVSFINMGKCFVFFLIFKLLDLSLSLIFFKKYVNKQNRQC